MEYQEEPKPELRSPPFGNTVDCGESNASVVTGLDGKKEKHLIQKIDLHIIPFVILLYLFSFLDRGMCFSFHLVIFGSRCTRVTMQ